MIRHYVYGEVQRKAKRKEILTGILIMAVFFLAFAASGIPIEWIL